MSKLEPLNKCLQHQKFAALDHFYMFKHKIQNPDDHEWISILQRSSASHAEQARRILFKLIGESQ